MKKRLALLLSVAMAFSMFANVAFGAEAAKTTQEKFNALKEAGIFAGFPGTDDAKLEQNTTRAEFARVVVKALGLKEVEGVYSYKDKNYGPKHWAAKYIEAVTAEGLMQGINASVRTTTSRFKKQLKFSFLDINTISQKTQKTALPTGLRNTSKLQLTQACSPRMQILKRTQLAVNS